MCFLVMDDYTNKILCFIFSFKYSRVIFAGMFFSPPIYFVHVFSILLSFPFFKKRNEI